MIDTQTSPPEHTARPLRVALAHDWLVGYRGGEMVLDAIARHLLQSGHHISKVYTMFDSGEPLSPTLGDLKRMTSSLNRYSPALRRWLLMRYPAAVRELTRKLHADHAHQPIDLLISTHSAAIKAIAPPQGVPHLCYCHSPARYFWSQTDQYASGDLKGRVRSLGLRTFAPALRRWDHDTASGVTQFIANSTHTADEIHRRYGCDSTVIHPPVRTDFFTPDPSIERSDELLLVSALEPYKRVDLAIDACRRINRPLIIVGTGSHEHALRKHAAGLPLIRFVGKVDNDQLLHHYRTAHAFLFPQIEDFGITAVEAQACACPVVARRAGGALDSVIEQKTGVFFDEPTPEAIAQAIERCPDASACADDCRANAMRFAPEVFTSRLNQIITQTFS